MITLVGCGFLGSIFAEEIAKRFFAFDEDPGMMFIDFDRYEERNAANQNISLKDSSDDKAESMHLLMDEYDLQSEYEVVKLDKSNIGRLLDDARIIVSALDNIPTRNLLWYYAKQMKKPLMTLGVSQMGTGVVEWTYRKHDSYSLSPLATLGQTKKLASLANTPKELKPCELIAFRGLGLNVGIAAAKSLGIFMGFDPEKVVNEVTGQDVMPKTVTAWDATNTGHTLRQIEETAE